MRHASVRLCMLGRLEDVLCVRAFGGGHLTASDVLWRFQQLQLQLFDIARRGRNAERGGPLSLARRRFLESGPHFRSC